MVCGRPTSILLELSATDNLDEFKRAVEIQGLDVNEASLWYGRRIGSRKMMGLEERTCLSIASLYGSFRILEYILKTLKVDANGACGSDGATALHFAASSGIDSSAEVVQLLIEYMADVDALDVNGNRPCDLIPPSLTPLKRKKLEHLLRGCNTNSYSTIIDEAYGESENDKEKEKEKPVKEYAIDVPLPDINLGLYSTDEFRMYSFKVKPCSRAYSHDWTECPFVHPGENARRRDPKKYQYTCVPCPEFRKGNCPKSDNCEYAHGVFESWLHPAQYRTRLCKDETGCLRKVCFFAHKHDELRPLYASTGSALPSPKSLSSGPIDMTPPMSPLGSSSSSPIPMWGNKASITPPPTLQLPGSRLKTALHARDLEKELEFELLGLENLRNRNQRQQQQLIDEISGLSSPYGLNLTPTNLDGLFGLSSSSPRLTTANTATTQLQMNALRSSYPAANLSSSPVRISSPQYGFDSSGGSGGAMAAAMMNSRSASFAKRSQSFIDRGASVNSSSNRTVNLGFTAAANSAGLFPSKQHTEWGSPDGKLEWGYMNKGEDFNKLRKSASFGYRGGNGPNRTTMAPSTVNEPDVSWVNSLVKDVSSVESAGLYNSKLELNSPWVEQLYIEHEQVSA